MRILLLAIVAGCMTLPCLAATGTYQLLWEVFDSPRQTTVCTYHSRAGDLMVTEIAGQVLCPRVV